MRNNAIRTWWKPWTWSSRTWLFAVVLATVAAPLALRNICLWQIPDVVLPFAIEDIIVDDLPKEENAYTVYEAIVNQTHLSPGVKSSASTETADSPANKTSLEQKLRQWEASDRQTLTEYLRAGSMEKSFGPSLRSIDYNYPLSFHQQFRQLSRHFAAQALVLEAYGELESAWDCHLGNLQLSIHAEQPYLCITNLIGIAIRGASSEGIIHWASNRAVTTTQLRKARADLIREFHRRSPALSYLKAEYVMMRNTLKIPQSMDYVLPTDDFIPDSHSIQVSKRILIWFFGQPELILRTYRQLMMNLSTELDKPLYQRSPSSKKLGIPIFELSPESNRATGQLNAAQLTKILECGNPLYKMSCSLIPAIGQLDGARMRDESRHHLLLVLLAANEFQRVHGQYPESLEQLVPDYLEQTPIDPLDASGHVLRYRRNQDGSATVWSVGANGRDDNGEIDLKVFEGGSTNFSDTGFQIKIRDDETAEEESSTRAVLIQKAEP